MEQEDLAEVVLLVADLIRQLTQAHRVLMDLAAGAGAVETAALDAS